MTIQAIDVLTALSSIATAIGVGVAASQLWVTRKQGVTAFEDSLTAQYRQIVSRFNILFGHYTRNEISQHFASRSRRFCHLVLELVCSMVCESEQLRAFGLRGRAAQGAEQARRRPEQAQ